MLNPLRQRILVSFGFVLSAGLLILGLILFTPSPAPAEPTITWFPPLVNETVTVGETKSFLVSLTPSESVSEVVVRVVPELVPFVQIEPASFQRIAKGETVDLNLTISSGPSSFSGKVEGTVQLRRGSKPPKTLAKPLPVTVTVQRIGIPMVSPFLINARTPTPVTVEIPIHDPTLISGHVRLERLDAAGSVIGVIGTLRDDGLNGDAALDDKVFTIRSTFNEPAAGEIRLRVSADFGPTATRNWSEVFSVRVTPGSDPEQVLDQLILDMRAGNTEAAAQKLAIPESDLQVFRSLDRATLNRLADMIAGRRLVSAKEDYRVYRGPWTDDQGVLRDEEFILVAPDGEPWKISSW